MLHDFLTANREELLNRCRAKVGQRGFASLFQILNRLLDNAIADAVSSYETHRDFQGNLDMHQRLGTLAEEQRRHLHTALKAFEALKAGHIGLRAATGSVLEDSLKKLRDVIDRSHPELRLSTGMAKPPQA